jgi:hypothetical protein
MRDPKTKAWLSLVVSFALITPALFLSAGTIQYWQAWLYLAVGVVSSVLLTQYIVNDPILLEHRTPGRTGCGTAAHAQDHRISRRSSGHRDIHRAGARSSFRLVERSALALHRGRCSDPAEHVDGISGLQGKLLRRRHGRNRQGPEGDLHRSLRRLTRRCISSACLWPSAPTGGSSLPSSQFLVWSGGCSTRNNSLPRICLAIANIARKSAVIPYPACSKAR